MQLVSECGSVIGVDYFVLIKRHGFGTTIAEQSTNGPVANLDGQDGTTLKEWLKDNKHIKAVIQDRTNAY